MSASHNPELEQQHGQNPEALEAERLFARAAYEALYTAENKLTPSITQLTAAQEWVNGLRDFDQQGNAIDTSGNVVMAAGSLSYVKRYFSDQNWLLGEHEKKALALFLHKPKHAKNHELITDGVPTTLANEIEAKLGPDTTPEEKQQRAEKIAHLRQTAAGLLSLDEAIHARAADAANAPLDEHVLARSAQVMQSDYDSYLELYTEQMRSDHPDFDQLDAVQQAELLQRATTLAQADALAAKENREHRQRQLRGSQTPVAAATQLESASATTQERAANLTETLAQLHEYGLDNITTIQQLDKALYVKHGEQSGPKTEALLDILRLHANGVGRLTDPVDMLAKQRRLQLRSSRNKAADKALGAEIVARNAQLETALAALNDYRDSLRRDLQTYQEQLNDYRFITIEDKVLAALDATEPTPKLTPESLATFLSSSEYAPRALELALQEGRINGYMLQSELHISVPRREQLVAQMVAAGLLSPERRGGGIRHTMIQSVDAFLPPSAATQTTTSETEPEPAATSEASTPKPSTSEHKEARKTPQRLTDLLPGELRDIRLAVSERVKEHLAWVVAQKREQLGKPDATLGRREEEFYAKEAYDEALEEQIVKAYGINDRDADYAQAIKEGAEALKYDLEKLRVKRASDVFADIVRHVGKELTEQVLRNATNRYLSRLSPEDRETFVVVFRQLASEALSAKTAAKPKPEQSASAVTSETRAQRSARLKGGRKSPPTGTPTPKDAVEANAWKTAIEA